MLTLKAVNKAIQQKHPSIELVKGEGYFYIDGLDEKAKTMVASLYQSGIYVFRINHLSIDRWVEEIDQLFK